jgi:hypothetical protein
MSMMSDAVSVDSGPESEFEFGDVIKGVLDGKEDEDNDEVGELIVLEDIAR